MVVENFNVDDEVMHARQDGHRITITFKKAISKKLFEDIRYFAACLTNKTELPEILLLRNPSQYIVGYTKESLPWVNGEITKRKYWEGHILLKTVSLFDIEIVFLQDFQKNFHQVLWPLPIPKYPQNPDLEVENPENKDVIYIRDLVSAMTEFFYFDFDECIRKIITSLENYFMYYKLKLPEKITCPDYVGKSKFKKYVYWHLQKESYHHQQDDIEILRDNMLFVYDIRCAIVHNELRLKLDDKDNQIFCKRAIGTLLKIYQSDLVRNDNKFNYIFSFEGQFVMLLDGVTGLNLDDLEKARRNYIQPKSTISGMAITRKINGENYP